MLKKLYDTIFEDYHRNSTICMYHHLYNQFHVWGHLVSSLLISGLPQLIINLLANMRTKNYTAIPSQHNPDNKYSLPYSVEQSDHYFTQFNSKVESSTEER